MSTRTTHETRIEADPRLPTVRITREFDAPAERVFRAFVDPDLVARWMGPRSISMEIATWDFRTGGSYRYTAFQDGEPVAHFYGSVHRVEENRKIVQTFGFEEMPDAVSLETATFENLDDGRSRVESLAVVFTMEDRDAMLDSGMEVGVMEGYERLDALLEEGAGV